MDADKLGIVDLWQNFKVERVVPGKKGWEVTTKQLETGQTSTTSYQAVVVGLDWPCLTELSYLLTLNFSKVCNGHYSDPVVPKIQGLDRYEGNLIHSHNYRLQIFEAGL